MNSNNDDGGLDCSDNFRRKFFKETARENGFEYDVVEKFSTALNSRYAIECMTDDEFFEFWYLAGKIKALRILDADESRKWSAWEKDDRVNYALHIIVGRGGPSFREERLIVDVTDRDTTEAKKKSQIDRLYDKIQDQNDWLQKDDGDGSFSRFEGKESPSPRPDSPRPVRERPISWENHKNHRSSLDDPYAVYEKIIDIKRFTATKDVVLPRSIRLCIELELDEFFPCDVDRLMSDTVHKQRKIHLYNFFHELSCFRVVGNTKIGKAQVTIGHGRGDNYTETRETWMKEIPIIMDVWTNFAEMEMPCFEETFPVKVRFIGVDGKSVQIYGIRHQKSMANVKESLVARGEYCPERFGFRYGLSVFSDLV